MKRLRVVLVDDEAPARAALRADLAEHDDVEVVGECRHGFEALEAVDTLTPDLLFLDIQMPKLSGFDVVEMLGDRCPPVIFVTAFDQYALRAFDVCAVDYLLKPYDPERLAESLRRVRASAAPPPAELSRHARGDAAEQLLLRDGAGVRVLAPERIDFVEAQGDWVVLAVGEERLRKQQTLGNFAKLLDPESFVRIHRSYILRVACLERVEVYAKDSRAAILRGGRRLPISRSGWSLLRARWSDS